MSAKPTPLIKLRVWAENDLPLLECLMSDPVMTRYLGGPETPEKIRNRHQKYLDSNGTDHTRVYVVVITLDNISAGSVIYWEREEAGQTVWEIGWSTLPEFQGQGIGTRATQLAIENARAEKRHQYMHAYPSVENEASNAICRKLGFVLLGATDFEYPKGYWMSCNDWQLDLFG
jgi:RimJ/RimL family protein N-acetyltransferase